MIDTLEGASFDVHHDDLTWEMVQSKGDMREREYMCNTLRSSERRVRGMRFHIS